MSIALSFCAVKVTNGEERSFVTGYVLDQSTMQPVVGAVVEYQEWNVSSKPKKSKDIVEHTSNNRAFTDANGRFVLLFDTNNKLVYSSEKEKFNGYPVKVSYHDISLFSIISLPIHDMKTRRQEKSIFHNLIVMDPEWIAIPPPTTQEFVRYSELVHLLTVTRVYCGGRGEVLQRSMVAVDALNKARKLSWRYKSLNDIDRQFVTESYLTANRLWQYFFSSCVVDDGTGSTEARILSEKINNEVEAYSFD